MRCGTPCGGMLWVVADAMTPEQVAAFLAQHHGAPIDDLESLSGGLWSSAFGYRVGGRDLVARFGEIRVGFEMDQQAAAWSGPDLPIPEVLAIGDALDRSFAISVRHHGRFLEDIGVDDAIAAGPAVDRMLAALRAIPAPPGAPSSWYLPGGEPEAATWRDFLLLGLRDDTNDTVSGWRPALAAHAAGDRSFRACERRIGELLDACPERRDVVHSDLLHQNVLVSDDASRITAVFSWKCSTRGDFLYDVAWCTFWSPWHAGIEALDLWGRTLAVPSLTDDDRRDADLRHHCYELQIGASHLGWNAWRGDDETLGQVVARLDEILERGPRQMR